MHLRATFRIGAVVLLALAAAACRRSGESKQLAALDSALQAGVIGKPEYDAKKAALASLAALDKARDAGLLTPAEYQERRQRLAAAGAVPAAAGTPATSAGAPGPVTAAGAPMPASASGAPVPATSTGAPMPASASATGAVRQENIFDAHLNLNAYNVTVPANWKFDGIYVPGSSCAQIPFPVFRMYSPDGLTEIRRLPRFDWSWSNSKFKPPQHSDCLDLKQELSAQEFVKYLIGMMQVAYVSDFPIPQEMSDALQRNFDQTNAAMAASAQQMDKLNASLPAMKNQPKNRPATQHGGLAAAIAEYRNGTFTIEEQIFVKLMCMHSPLNFGTERDAFADSCNATVRIVRAPKGQLDALLVQAQKLGAVENPEWASRYFDYMQAQAKARSDQMFRDSNARLQRQHDDFERAQAVRAQQHQQFLATMQEGTDRSMARAAEAANSRHAIAQDWCDYALDRQTVTGPGGTVKISNAYSQTWTDGSGNYYQTNDPNTNPNGVLRGNWTQTTQVHGDGTAK
jgi:hypothetical protein